MNRTEAGKGCESFLSTAHLSAQEDRCGSAEREEIRLDSVDKCPPPALNSLTIRCPGCRFSFSIIMESLLSWQTHMSSNPPITYFVGYALGKVNLILEHWWPCSVCS